MRQAVESPCNKVCQMDPKSGLCIGCARTLDEIARWAEMSDAERERVLAELPARGQVLNRAAKMQQFKT
jgi:predicted Fe-S protein YdhL (DUF1289 family)